MSGVLSGLFLLPLSCVALSDSRARVCETTLLWYCAVLDVALVILSIAGMLAGVLTDDWRHVVLSHREWKFHVGHRSLFGLDVGALSLLALSLPYQRTTKGKSLRWLVWYVLHIPLVTGAVLIASVLGAATLYGWSEIKKPPYFSPTARAPLILFASEFRMQRR
jgi:hypothetical protein